MSNDGIRSAIRAASDYLEQHPQEARSTDSAAVATLVDGLVARVIGPDGATITTDMVPSVGGTASAPSPGWLLRAAEASCVVTLITMRAAMLGIILDTLEVTVDSVSDDRGLLGIDDAVPAGPLTGRVSVRLTAAGVDASTLEDMARWGVRHCPVCDALERAVPVTTVVSTTWPTPRTYGGPGPFRHMGWAQGSSLRTRRAAPDRSIARLVTSRACNDAS